MSKKLESKICKINYPESLSSLALKTLEILEKKIDEYQEFFGIKLDEQFIVNYFDDVEEFREFVYSLREEKGTLPDYARGTYDNGMINACIDPNIQQKKVYISSHELFHILYMKYILNGDYSKRIIWYDEGMAQFMSGEKDNLNDEEQFKKYYFRVKEETKVVPNMNSIKHGKTFWNKDYNGYYLGYLAVRYLYETLSPEEFKSLATDIKKISQIGENIASDMFKYFDKKLINEKRR